MNRSTLATLAMTGAAALLFAAPTGVRSVATASPATAGPAIKVNPLSQHASHCAQPTYYDIDCFVVLKNTRTTATVWWMETQRQSSYNAYEYSTLNANGQSGQFVTGTLAAGQSVSVEIVTQDCYTGYGAYWTWIVGSSAGSTLFAPQAAILSCP